MFIFRKHFQQIKVSERGFTLTEVLVVIAMMSILLLMASGSFIGAVASSEEIAEKSIPDPSKVENTFAKADAAEAVAYEEMNARAEAEAAEEASQEHKGGTLLVWTECDENGNPIVTHVENKPWGE